MKTISLTGVGIAGAIQAINRHMDEQIEKAKRPAHPPFPYTLDRAFEGQGDIELEIEVRHYHAPGNNRGLDSRDPAYDGGEVEFGTAVEVATGKTIELTPSEWEQVEAAFWG